MSHERICMAVTESMVRLEPSNCLHVLLFGSVCDDAEPMLNRLAVSLLDRREIGGRAFALVFHGPVSLMLNALAESAGKNRQPQLSDQEMLHGGVCALTLRQLHR